MHHFQKRERKSRICNEFQRTSNYRRKERGKYQHSVGKGGIECLQLCPAVAAGKLCTSQHCGYVHSIRELCAKEGGICKEFASCGSCTRLNCPYTHACITVEQKNMQPREERSNKKAGTGFYYIPPAYETWKTLPASDAAPQAYNMASSPPPQAPMAFEVEGVGLTLLPVVADVHGGDYSVPAPVEYTNCSGYTMGMHNDTLRMNMCRSQSFSSSYCDYTPNESALRGYDYDASNYPAPDGQPCPSPGYGKGEENVYIDTNGCYYPLEQAGHPYYAMDSGAISPQPQVQSMNPMAHAFYPMAKQEGNGPYVGSRENDGLFPYHMPECFQ